MIRIFASLCFLYRAQQVVSYQLRASPDKKTVCVSVAVFEGPEYVEALIKNFKTFSEPSTKLAMHLDAHSEYNDTDKWESDKVAITSKRIEVQAFQGSILYSHMLNARTMESTWPGECSYWVLQASNMMWVRRGMEDEVRRKEYSPLGAKSEPAGCSTGKRREETIPNSETWASFTYKLGEGRHQYGWGQPEGSFFPMSMVRDFNKMLKKHLKKMNNPEGDQIYNAECYFENVWLQTYALNYGHFDKYELYEQERGKATPLCLNWITYGDKESDSIPMDKVKAVMEGGRSGESSPMDERFFAVKRINRNINHPITQYIMSLSN